MKTGRYFPTVVIAVAAVAVVLVVAVAVAVAVEAEDAGAAEVVVINHLNHPVEKYNTHPINNNCKGTLKYK